MAETVCNVLSALHECQEPSGIYDMSAKDGIKAIDVGMFEVTTRGTNVYNRKDVVVAIEIGRGESWRAYMQPSRTGIGPQIIAQANEEEVTKLDPLLAPDLVDRANPASSCPAK